MLCARDQSWNNYNERPCVPSSKKRMGLEDGGITCSWVSRQRLHLDKALKDQWMTDSGNPSPRFSTRGVLNSHLLREICPDLSN